MWTVYNVAAGFDGATRGGRVVVGAGFIGANWRFKLPLELLLELLLLKLLLLKLLLLELLLPELLLLELLLLVLLQLKLLLLKLLLL